MASKPHYIPDGLRSITPTISVADAAKAIDFYKTVFGATEVLRIEDGHGKVGHCELLIGNSTLMICDIFDGRVSTPQYDPFMFGLHLYVENSDAVCEKAIAAGASLLRPLETKFYGDRSCAVQDPFGHTWHISTHLKDVPPDELKKLAAEQGRHLKEVK